MIWIQLSDTKSQLWAVLYGNKVLGLQITTDIYYIKDFHDMNALTMDIYNLYLLI